MLEDVSQREYPLKQKTQKVILVYGTLQLKEITKKTLLPVIDVTDASWPIKVASKVSVEKATDCTFYCLSTAYIIAKKKLPKGSVKIIQQIEEVPSEEALETENQEAAVKVDSVTVTNSFHPSVRQARAWMNSYHIELIDKILGNGYVVEILDSRNQVVRTLKEKTE